MKAKHCLRALLFAVLVTALLTFSSWLLRDRTTTLAAMYSEPDQSLDVIIVGSSHVNSGYIPNILWEENNASACNVFSWSQPMWISYHYIVETLKTQTPKVIVLELFGMTYGHSYIMPQEIDKTSYANSFTIDPGWNRLQMIATSEKCGLDLRDSSEFLNIIRYHSRWKEFSPEMLRYNPHKDPDPLKGYGLLLNSTPCAIQPMPAAEPTVPYEYAVEYLDRIVALCRERNITLIFTMTPYTYGEQEPGIYRWLEDYAAQNGIPFLNYNGADGERIGFDPQTDMADHGHLNYFGAVKVTKDLSAYLKEHCVFPAKEEHANCEQLNADLAVYHRIIAVQDVLVEKDPARYLQLCTGLEGVTLYVVNTGRSEAVTGHLAQWLPAAEGGAYRTLIWNREQSVVDRTETDAVLFGQSGTVRMDPATGEIWLNGVLVPKTGDLLTIVVYDEVLGRPLDVAYITAAAPDTVQHREFTTDVLAQFRK